MGGQTVLPFKLERTDETLTAHGGLALLAECNHGLGICGLTDRYLPGPGSNRGYAPSVFVDRLIPMLPAGGRSLAGCGKTFIRLFLGAWNNLQLARKPHLLRSGLANSSC
jgi:hypothetical protein